MAWYEFVTIKAALTWRLQCRSRQQSVLDARIHGNKPHITRLALTSKYISLAHVIATRVQSRETPLAGMSDRLRVSERDVWVRPWRSACRHGWGLHDTRGARRRRASPSHALPTNHMPSRHVLTRWVPSLQMNGSCLLIIPVGLVQYRHATYPCRLVVLYSVSIVSLPSGKSSPELPYFAVRTVPSPHRLTYCSKVEQ